ncbi:hypothetical protein BDP81DRAFT_113250 [Colletotrichum phormii]|uniref:Uncharacterized protein n=1 Tax=Colletotrichum phormii TaxID=359342 RepID=A0AAI9ZGT7_9PEZI|nr:uncharacterized protein BDP81DRAFT_113250 [Colletotrichum phormii]KAK1624290.1 hypothetical protein BDP81DRAFT_113250 [Colletotrichum phormii]
MKLERRQIPRFRFSKAIDEATIIPRSLPERFTKINCSLQNPRCGVLSITSFPTTKFSPIFNPTWNFASAMRPTYTPHDSYHPQAITGTGPKRISTRTRPRNLSTPAMGGAAAAEMIADIARFETGFRTRSCRPMRGRCRERGRIFWSILRGHLFRTA